MILNYRFSIILFLLSLFSFSQQPSDSLLRQKKIKITQPSIQIDTFSIQPFYFEVKTLNGKKIEESNYQVDFVNAKINFINYKVFKDKELWFYYKIYPSYFRKIYQKYNWQTIQKDSLSTSAFMPMKIFIKKPFERLKTQGKITRGFNAGNQQSLVMKSGLDLKISGRISPKLEIKAVLSDDNLPQAYAGISQSYKEFNQIYMQLTAPKWQATGGDLYMNEQPGYFIKFSRKIQGLDIQFKRDKSQTNIEAGVINGQYGINKFKPIDGNQGPYLLRGNQDENYIFIIPKSEKVYVNGHLLQPQKDYVLNNETAELTFQPDFPITGNQRITVEFNYANQHYIRYTNFNRYKQTNNSFSWSIYSFLETDAKNQTLLYDLTSQEINALKNSGDQANNLWVKVATPSTYDPDKILYQEINNGAISYFQYTNQDVSNLYEVRFSYVGPQQGNYNIRTITAIGKIYEYAGENQGDYVAAIRLTPPEVKQYVGMNFKGNITEKTNLDWDGVLNYNDQNLFSNIDDQNNLGGAMHLKIKQLVWHQKETSLNINAQYDFIHKDFKALDTYRPIEFNREWQIDSIYGEQHLADFNIAYHHQNNNLSLGSRYLSLGNDFSAQQFFYNTLWQEKKWTYKSSLRYTIQHNESDLKAFWSDQNWIRHFSKTDLQFTGEIDIRNKKTNGVYDSLNYRYTTLGIQWQKRDSLIWQWQFFYKYEQNDSIQQQIWKKTEQTNNFGVKIAHHNATHQIKIYAQYREKQLEENISTQQYLNIKFLWQQTYLQSFLQTQLQIESFNGNTLRDDVIFVETPAGQGIYLWNDYNGNGLKEINEFEIALYSDQANYIRVVLPGKKYLPTLNNLYQFQLTINPAAWQKHPFWQHIFGRIKMTNQHQSLKNSTFKSFIWQPDQILTQQMLSQHDWYWNRGKKYYQIHFTYRQNIQKQLLSVGMQSHEMNLFKLNTKHTLKKHWQWQQQFLKLYDYNTAENYDLKNFDLKTEGFEEGLGYQPQTSNQIYLYYKYKFKQNLSGIERLKMTEFGIKLNFHKKTQKQFNLDLKYINNKFTGDQLAPVSFKMLESLQPGKNVVSQLLYQKNINAYLQLSLNLGFRISQSTLPVYTGGIQMSMNF